MKISVIGTGYVGLVTGACLAEIGHDVMCTDNDASKIKTLESGGMPIYEPGLEKVIPKARKDGRLTILRQSRRCRCFRRSIFYLRGHSSIAEWRRGS